MSATNTTRARPRLSADNEYEGEGGELKHDRRAQGGIYLKTLTFSLHCREM
jgi:hypothetical protein